METKIFNLKTVGTLLVLFVMVSFLSCKKDENKNSVSMIVGTWQTINYEKKAGINATWSQVNDLSCRLEERLVYDMDGEFSQLFGSCATDNSTLKGTWKLSADNSTITYTYAKYNGEFARKVDKLTENELVISWDSGSTTGTYYRTSYRKVN